MRISVVADVRQVERMLTKAQKRVIPAAASFALNRAIVTVGKETRQTIKRDMNLVRMKVITNAFKIKRASRNRLVASIMVHNKSIWMREFKGGRQMKEGARVAPFGQSKIIAGSFRHKDSTGRFNVYSREGASRYPIKVERGPRLGPMITSRKRTAVMGKIAKREFIKNFKREVSRRVGR